jgi:superfamily I DNA/RNA helicase
VTAASAATGTGRFSANFVHAEWAQVVDAWQVRSWEAYRDVPRLGRKTRLPEAQRALLWQVFEEVHRRMAEAGAVTYAEVFSELAAAFAAGGAPPFEFAIVDEAQDVSVAQLRFLAAIGGGRANGLFFAGDLGQRIFQQPFSWKALGVDVRGRSRTLRINYRTSHQIRKQADRLLGPEMSDADGNLEVRRGTVSVFNGPAPVIAPCGDAIEECAAVSRWLRDRVAEGLEAGELAVVVRSEAEVGRAQDAVAAAGLASAVLDTDISTTPGRVSVATMQLVKGLEFRAVAVMACDDDVIPSPGRIETAADEGELLEVYNTERQLLYVACTRARDQLLVTSGGSPSEFVDDLREERGYSS